MRSHIFLLASLLLFGCGLPFSPAEEDEKIPEPDDPQQEAECSTLSELGVDFGAAELVRFSELELSDEQKKQTLSVVSARKAKIDQLCERMTAALKMGEDVPGEKSEKEIEIAAVVEQFKRVQAEIMSGLHAVLTKDQVARLETIKKRERKKAHEAEERRSATATG